MPASRKVSGSTVRLPLISVFGAAMVMLPFTLPDAVFRLSGGRMSWPAWMAMLPPAPPWALALMWVRVSARQHSTASAVNQIVSLPRTRSPASYSANFEPDDAAWDCDDDEPRCL